MTEAKQRKPRTKFVLPTAIDNGDGEEILLSQATISGLETAMNARKEWIASVDRDAVKKVELEIRAIKGEIRNRLK